MRDDKRNRVISATVKLQPRRASLRQTERRKDVNEHIKAVNNEHIKAVNDSSGDLDRPDDILAPEFSDEELEAEGVGTAKFTWGTAGGYLTSTPQCCNF
jgi:hypothetical protein